MAENETLVYVLKNPYDRLVSYLVRLFRYAFADAHHKHNGLVFKDLDSGLMSSICSLSLGARAERRDRDRVEEGTQR